MGKRFQMKIGVNPGAQYAEVQIIEANGDVYYALARMALGGRVVFWSEHLAYLEERYGQEAFVPAVYEVLIAQPWNACYVTEWPGVPVNMAYDTRPPTKAQVPVLYHYESNREPQRSRRSLYATYDSPRREQ